MTSPALSTELGRKLAGRTFESIGLGESGASVWRCTIETAPALYLKLGPIAADLHLENEAHRLRWMKAHALPVPTVREHGRFGDDIEYILMDELSGAPASASEWMSSRPQVVRALGEVLARLHETDVADCPFDQRIANQITHVRRRIAASLVREDDFDDARVGRSVTDLFAELLRSAPSCEDLVFVHGDFCLPNIILQSTARDERDERDEIEVVGLIDCGRAGVADRHQDLALAVRSIAYNIGSEWVQPFLEAYGLAQPDSSTLSFFALLDEFF